MLLSWPDANAVVGDEHLSGISDAQGILLRTVSCRDFEHCLRIPIMILIEKAIHKEHQV